MTYERELPRRCAGTGPAYPASTGLPQKRQVVAPSTIISRQDGQGTRFCASGGGTARGSSGSALTGGMKPTISSPSTPNKSRLSRNQPTPLRPFDEATIPAPTAQSNQKTYSISPNLLEEYGHIRLLAPRVPVFGRRRPTHLGTFEGVNASRARAAATARARQRASRVQDWAAFAAVFSLILFVALYPW